MSERDPTHACPLNDHSGSNGVGTPSSFRGHPMSTVASMQESTMRRLFSARFRPMQILYALATPTISTLRYYFSPHHQVPNQVRLGVREAGSIDLTRPRSIDVMMG